MMKKVGHVLLLGIISITWSIWLHTRLVGHPPMDITDPINQPIALPIDVNSTHVVASPQTISSSRKEEVETILIIATVPYTSEHVMALWSQLECLTEGVDRVHISAPDADWSRFIIGAVIKEFQQLSSARSSSDNIHSFEIESSFHTNNRYDAGLWCDGLRTLGFDGENFLDENAATTTSKSTTKPHAIFLINDSSVAIRRYNSLTGRVVKSAQVEQIESNSTIITTNNKGKNNLKLVSLNGNLIQPGQTKHYWVESVYRGLTPQGVPKFYKHTCTPEAGRACVGKTGNGKKQCIVNRYEMSLAESFHPREVDAMYPTYLPKQWDATSYYTQNERGGIGPDDQWIRGRRYFRYLVAEHDFPMRKIKWPAGQPAPPQSKCLELLGGDLHGGGKNNEFLVGLGYPDEETFEKFREDMLKSESTL